uniref:Uncharacterized protein n=1 Tax=uncultured bacterium Csd4 TaxID=1637487 RepID=A0A0F6YS25_9BACT|nr:hypothetical protein [uncultured bacterium Csd4]
MFLKRRFYLLIVVIAILMAIGYLATPSLLVGQVLLVALVVMTALDALALYTVVSVSARRECPNRFSNGDENEVTLRVANNSRLPLSLTIIDELPPEFQIRDLKLSANLDGNRKTQLNYNIRPTQRGKYEFGHILVFASTKIGLVERRFSCGEPFAVKVYPSYIMLRKYELMAVSNNLTEMGIKRIRRAGNNTDFEQIKDYVQGDEYRRINWKASARRTHLYGECISGRAVAADFQSD